MSDMLFLIGPLGKILTANSASHRILGYPDNHLVGQSVKSVLDKGVEHLKWIDRALSGEVPPGEQLTDQEVFFVNRAGESIPASLAGTVVRDEYGTVQGVLLIGRDISARKRAEREKAKLESRYQQSQKLESIGRLAGGVAHDMNNILGAIMTSAYMLEGDDHNKRRIREDVETILTACRRGRDLTRDMLGFARKGKYHKEHISFEKLIEATVAILQRTVSKRVAFQIESPGDSIMIEGDRGQIQNALINICLNAVDAMAGAGTLRFVLQRVEIALPLKTDSDTLEPGDYVHLSVIDTGSGIDPELLPKVFEPFFTTKQMGQGTGLGLSMAYGVVVNHGGLITLASKKGEGTTVDIYLPAQSGPWEAPERSVSPERAVTPPEGACVLLVDDEELILVSARRLLEKMGYDVIEAANGLEALRLYEEHGASVSLVLLDMLMPEMDGAQTFRRLMEIDPDVKVVLFSGYNRDDQVNELLANGALGYVQKPFDRRSLAGELAKAF